MPGRSSNTANANDIYKFTGHERDAELSLDYMLARNYDPEIGRFLSVDPLYDKYPGLSPYVYVAGNPLNATDPDGRMIDPVTTAKGIVGGGFQMFKDFLTGSKRTDGESFTRGFVRGMAGAASISAGVGKVVGDLGIAEANISVTEGEGVGNSVFFLAATVNNVGSEEESQSVDFTPFNMVTTDAPNADGTWDITSSSKIGVKLPTNSMTSIGYTNSNDSEKIDFGIGGVKTLTFGLTFSLTLPKLEKE